MGGAVFQLAGQRLQFAVEHMHVAFGAVAAADQAARLAHQALVVDDQLTEHAALLVAAGAIVGVQLARGRQRRRFLGKQIGFQA